MNEKNSTPTDVFKTFITARKDGDVEAMRRCLTENALDIVQGISTVERKTFEEALNSFGLGRKLSGICDSKSLLAMRNESIIGNFAYLEVKNFVSGEFQNFSFLRENNVWKIALDMEVVNDEQSLSEILGALLNYVKNAFGKFVSRKSKR